MTVARSKLEARPRPRKLLGRSRGISKTFNRACLKRREIVSVETLSNGQEDVGAGRRRAGELEREYYEQLEALKFLIDPPPCFRNTETRQNFENKLNSLDFRRMNTVAIPEEPVANGNALNGKTNWIRGKNSGSCEVDRGSSCAKTLDRIMQERLRIERTMIDLFVRAPILKSSHGEQVSFTRENKTVRFKDEVERSGTSVGSWERSEGENWETDEVESSDRVKIEITRKKRSDACRDDEVMDDESSETLDVETRNGR